MATKKSSSSSFVTFLLNLISLILEILLSSAASRRFQNFDDEEEETYRDTNDGDNTNKIKAALKYFELADTQDAAALREAVKKKYRKLSLLHHPDRNDNSEESVKEMQKVNHHYNVLNEELDRREGIVHHEEDEGAPEPTTATSSHEEEHTDEHTGEQPKKKKKGKGRKAKNKPSKASKEEARRRRQEAQAREEQEKEWQEVQRQQQKIKKMKRKMFRKVQSERTRHGLNTEEGRKQANFKFEEAMGFTGPASAAAPSSVSEDERTVSVHDIDGDDVHEATEPEWPEAASPTRASNFETESAKKEKPKNFIMECCMDEIALALRLELPDAAMEIIQKRISDGIYRKLLSRKKVGRESDFEWAAAAGSVEFLLEPLDEDDNTILHYAVYYESMDVISMVYFYACKCNALPDIFLRENRYGHIPADFCQCCVKTDALPERMKSLTETARAAQPSLDNSIQRLKSIVTNIDWVSVLNAAASVFVGVGLFDVRMFVAVIVTTTHLWSTEGGTPEFRVATLFSWHISWWVLKSILSWIHFNWFSAFVLLLLIPLILYSRMDRILYVVLLVPSMTTFVALCVVTELRVPARLSKYRLDDIYYCALLCLGSMLAGWCLSGLWYRISKLFFWCIALPGRVFGKLGSLLVGVGGDRAAVKSGAVRSEGLEHALDRHRQALIDEEEAGDLEF